MTKRKVDPSADLRRDPAQDLLNVGVNPRKNYTRTNIFISEEDRATWEDFKIYARSINMSVSELLNNYMRQTVKEHAAEIKEAKIRFENARRRYEK